MSVIIAYLICLSLVSIHSSVIPKRYEKLFHQNLVVDKGHLELKKEHTPEYDHEAFLGLNDAKTFKDLSPEESRRRLGLIVDKIDSDKDGFVTMQELKDWIQHISKQYIVEDTQRQWKGLNPSNKQEISWDTYKNYTYGFSDDMEKTDVKFSYKLMMERDQRRWQKADQDYSGSLNLQEFMDFVHPEESEHMKEVFVVETIEDIDKDQDGKISIEEYIGDLFNDVGTDLEPEQNLVQSERDQFTQFRDKDRSGYLEFDEVRRWILPENFDNSDAEAKHLIYESDVDRDNQLNKEEILNKFDLFVGSQVTDFGDALVRHDEF